MFKDTRKPRVFHVDDDPDFLSIFTLFFSESLEITSFEKGRDMLEALDRGGCDVVVTDYEMSSMNGLELLRHVRLAFPDMPVIFYTGQGSQEIAREAFVAGADDYFVKDLAGFMEKEKLINSIYRTIRKKRTEEALRESQEMFARAFHSSPIAMALASFRNGRMIDVNEEFAALMELGRDDILGRTSVELGIWENPADRDRILDRIEKNEQIRGVELSFRSAEGRQLTLLWSAEKVTVGGVPCLLSSAQDITGMKQREKLLRESQEKYRSLIEDINEVLYSVDEKGIITFISPVIETMSGYRPEEVAGTSFALYIHKDDLPELLESFERQKNGSVEANEYRIITKNRSPIWVRSFSKPVIEDGQVKGMNGVLTNISTIKENELTLRKWERELQLTLDSTADGIWKWDFRDDSMFFSPNYYRMLGYEPGDFPSTYESWVALVHPDDRKHALQVVHEYLSEKPDVYENVFRLRTRDGGYRWIRARAKVVERDSEGKALRMIGSHEDITESTMSGHIVQKAMERGRELEEIIQESPVVAMIWEASPGWPVLFVSENISQFGYNAWDLADGRVAYSDMVHPDDLERVAEEVSRYTREGLASYSQEYRILTPGGEVRWLDDRTRVVRDESGKALKYLGVLLDVTEKKKSEEELRQSDHRFRQLAQAASEGVVIHDGAVILDANEAFAGIFGCRLEEIVGMDTAQFMAPKSMECVIENSRNGIEGTFIYDGIKKDGTALKLEASAKNITFQGKPARIATVRDVTRQIGMDKRLRDREAYVRTILDRAGIPVVVIGLDGRIEEYNQAFEKAMGYSREELDRMNTLDLTFPDDREQTVICLEMLMRGEADQQRMEKRCLRKDGATQWFDLTLTTIKDEKGNVISLIGSLLDITGKRRIEEELVRKNKEMSDFVYMVSHDLKSPLVIFKGFLGMIREDPASLEHCLERLESQAGVMSQLIDELLRFSRAGAVIQEKEKIDPAEKIRSIYNTQMPDGMKSSLEISPGLPGIYGDPGRMEQVFSNIITNSFHFADLQKETHRLEVSCTIEGDSGVFRLSDNGLGIKEDLLEKIFEAGFTSGSKPQGTGFGLAIARKIVEAHGGSIWAESQGERKGAAFCIRIPITP
jgi:PAS domain S-box-containing protein